MSVHDIECDGGVERIDAGSHPFPVRLRGGYLDGARLVGVEEDTALYYDRVARSLVRYRHDPEDELLQLDRGGERTLPRDTAVGTYLRLHGDELDGLSAWGRVLAGDGRSG